MFKQSIKSVVKPPCFKLVTQEIIPKIDYNSGVNQFGPFKVNQIPNSQIAKDQPKKQTTLNNDITQMKNINN